MSDKELRALCAEVVKRGRTTAEEKRVIAAECEARGIGLNAKCANCYIDAAAIIYNQLPEPDPEENGREWVLRDGVDVTFGGIRVCAATITDELADGIVALGFELSFFAKHPQR